jgi:hypothetical protein
MDFGSLLYRSRLRIKMTFRRNVMVYRALAPLTKLRFECSDGNIPQNPTHGEGVLLVSPEAAGVHIDNRSLGRDLRIRFL